MPASSGEPDGVKADRTGRIVIGLVTRTCPFCGIDFVSQASRKKRCCSRSCGSSLQKIEAKAAGRKIGRPFIGEHKPCEICGTSVYVKPWQAKSGQGRFCSKDCFNMHQARNAVEHPCDWCGKPMTMSPSQSKVRRFCSWECQAEGRRTRALDRVHNGKRAALWNDGYVYVWEPDHPRSAIYGGWYAEHRLVMEQHIGRVLEAEEIVHHKDGDKKSNVLSNLQIVTEIEHQLLTRDQILDRRRAAKKRLAELEVMARRQAARLAAYEAAFGPLPPDDGSSTPD